MEITTEDPRVRVLGGTTLTGCGGKPGWVSHIVVGDDYVYTATADTVEVWDKDSLGLAAVLQWDKEKGSGVSALAACRDFVYCGMHNGTVRVWEKRSWEEAAVLKGHFSKICGLAADGKYLYSGSSNKLVVWKKKKWEVIWQTEQPYLCTAGLLVDKKTIYTASSSSMTIWKKGSFKEVGAFHAGRGIVAVSHDKKYIYAGSRSDEIRVIRKGTWEEVATITGRSADVVTIHVDDRWLYAAYGDGTLVGWRKGDWGQGTVVDRADNGKLALASDDERLYCGSVRDGVDIWRKSDSAPSGRYSCDGKMEMVATDGEYLVALIREELRVIDGKRLKEVATVTSPDRVWRLAAHDKSIYVATSMGGVRVWRVGKSHEEAALVGRPHGRVNAMAFDNDRMYCAIGNGTVVVWSYGDWQEQASFEVPSTPYSMVVDDQHIYVGCSGGTIDVRRRDTLDRVTVVEGLRGDVDHLAVDDEFLYAGCRSSVYAVHKDTWELETVWDSAESIGGIMVHDGLLYCTDRGDHVVLAWRRGDWERPMTGVACRGLFAALPVKGAVLVVSEGAVVRWRLGPWERSPRPPGHPAWVAGLATDDQHVYVGAGQSVTLWSKDSWEPAPHGIVPQGKVVALAVGNGYVACGISNGNAIELWRTDDWSMTARFRFHDRTIKQMAMDDQFLYSASGDWSVGVVSTRGRPERVVRLRLQKGEWAVSVHSDGKYLYVGAGNNTVQIREVGEWEQVTELGGHEDWCVALTSTDELLFTGSWDGSVRVWKKDTWEQVAAISTGSRVLSLQSDEQFIYAGLDDHTVCVWRIGTWERVAVLKGHIAGVKALAHDSAALYSGAADRWVMVWPKSLWT